MFRITNSLPRKCDPDPLEQLEPAAVVTTLCVITLQEVVSADAKVTKRL